MNCTGLDILGELGLLAFFGFLVLVAGIAATVARIPNNPLVGA